MRTSCSSSKSSNYSRAFDLPQDHIPRDDHGFRHNIGGGPMLPVFLNDLRRNAVDQRRVVVLDDGDDDDDLVEVTLELEKENNSVVLCSIAPPPVSINCESNCSLASTSSIVRSFSASSRIGRKFQWLRTLSFSSAEINHLDLSTRDAMKLKAKLVRTKSCAQRALGGLRFINKTMGDSSEPNELWKRVESRFDSLAKDGLLSRHDFADCIGMADSKEFALGVFDVLERRRRHQNEKIGHITKAELHDFWLQITDQSFDARLQIFFDMADSNEDGRVTRNEVQELIMLSASANKLSKLKERAEEYAALIMEELDPENLGYIELWQLEALLLQRENYMNYSRPLSTASVSWSQNLNAYRAGVVCRLRFKLKCLVLENWQRGWILLLWLSVMAGLFVWKFKQYKEKAAFQVMGYCLTTAKGAAETLKLNMALILLPICRNILTFLRSTRARLFIPFNDNINFHKIIAYAIGIGVLIHAGNHMACDFPRLIKSSPEKFSLIASDFNNKKPSYKYLLTGVEGITGISMVILLIVAFTLATPHFRKNLLKLPGPFNRLTGFNAFWFSHHLTALVYILLMVHGNFLFLVDKWYQKTTWMYISAPLLLYVAERCLRTCRSEYYSVKLLKVSILPGDVFNIIMSKPSGFKYKSGQYIFLQCPSISPFEWHPFSITSAPGDDDLSIHIRTVGDWTQELKRVFTEDNCSPCVIGRAKFGQHHVDQTGYVSSYNWKDSDQILANLIKHIPQCSLPRLFVDGPYGAPAQDYQNYDILLLVGLGIGATPFISILRDLINNTRTFEDQTDSNTENSKSEDSLTSFASSNMTPNEKKKSQRTRSAHFYWVTREPGSFEWFEGVMNEVAEMDHKGHIEMHNYLTSVYEEGDARSTLITMVQALNHAKHGIDILSGTRVRTHFARPNWKEEFTKIAQKHPFATVGVFYCGMPVLAKELKELSHELSHKTSTRFEFHKEYF